MTWRSEEVQVYPRRPPSSTVEHRDHHIAFAFSLSNGSLRVAEPFDPSVHPRHLTTDDILATDEGPGLKPLQQTGDPFSPRWWCQRPKTGRDLGRVPAGRNVTQQVLNCPSGARPWQSAGQHMWRCQRRLQDSRNARGDPFRVRFVQIRQHNDGQIEVGIPLNRPLKPTPRSAVANPSIAPLLRELPAQPIGVGPTFIQPNRGPARLETSAARGLLMVEGDRPLGQVSRAKAQPPVGGRAQRG